MEKKKTVTKNKDLIKFKEKYFDYYDDIKHQNKSKDIEW